MVSLSLSVGWFTPWSSSVVTLTHWHCPGSQCEEPHRAPDLLIAPDMETYREKWIYHLCASVCVHMYVCVEWSECQLSNSFHTSLIELDGQEDCIPNWIAETLCCKQCCLVFPMEVLKQRGASRFVLGPKNRHATRGCSTIVYLWLWLTFHKVTLHSDVTSSRADSLYLWLNDSKGNEKAIAKANRLS